MKLSHIYKFIFFPALVVILMWLFKLAETYFDLNLSTLGIYPRKTGALRGIFLAPFIHGDFKHLISNTAPIFLLTTAILYFYRKIAYQLIFFSWILTGLLVWIGGRYSWHIGASGLVYAFASFLFFSGVLNKNRQLIAVSLLVAFLYGGIFWGIFPGKKGISWESHLFGFLIGFVFAFFYGKEHLFIEMKEDVVSVNDFSEVSSSHSVSYEYHFKEK